MVSIQWPIYVADADDLIGLGLDSIVWQRATSEDGTYVDLTATAATAATLTGTVAQTFNISGETFIASINGVTYTVTFTGTDPLTISDVVSQCNSVFPGTPASDEGGKLKLTTGSTGTSETLVIGDGTANSILGFDEDDSSIGKEAYVALAGGQTVYSFTDESGDPDYWYRYRFIEDATDGYTPWRYPGQGYQASPVAVSKLCWGYVKVVDTGGTAYSDVELLVVNVASADGVAVTGVDHNILGPRITATTDDAGEAGVWLLRGSIVDISIEGTGLVRRVTIPDAATVNLLDSSIADDDIFSVQTFDIPEAIRRSL